AGNCPRNSSRKSRRIDFADREYRAKSAPFTVSGRFLSAKTGRSVLVKYGASALVSSGVNASTAAGEGGEQGGNAEDTEFGYSTSHDWRRLPPSPHCALSRLRCDG